MSFTRLRFWSGPVAFCLMLLLLPKGMQHEARMTAAVASWIIFWWMLEPVPLPVTSLFAGVLPVLTGLTGAKTALAPFADPVIFLFLGGFLLAKAMSVHELDLRFARFMLDNRWARENPWRSIVSLLAAAAFLSMWISNTAATAVMLPIATAVLSSILPKNTAKQGSILLLVAYASAVGGLATPVGSPPNAVAIGMLRRLTGQEVGFLSWMALALPVTLAMFGVLLLMARFILKPRKNFAPLRSAGGPELKPAYSKQAGKMSAGQKSTLVAGLFAVVLWILPDLIRFLVEGTEIAADLNPILGRLNTSTVAMIASGLLFFLPAGERKKRRPALTWQEASQIDWGTLLLFGGGLSLGSLIFQSGLAAEIGALLQLSESWPLFIALTLTTALILTEFSSNTATANLLIPILIASSRASAGAPGSEALQSLIVPVVGGALACSLGFMLPVGTPPNAIVYSTGLIPIRRMIRQGACMDVLGLLCLFAWAFVVHHFSS